jgi:hypothetical protein
MGQLRSVLADGQLKGHQLGLLLQPVLRVHRDREADQYVYALDVDAIEVGLELQHERTTRARQATPIAPSSSGASSGFREGATCNGKRP